MQLYKDHFDGIIQLLREGKLLLMPTDTIWGLVCAASQSETIQRIYQMKQQKPQSGLVVLVKDLEMLKTVVPKLHPRIETLLIYHRRPVTIIYEDSTLSKSAACASDGSIAIRLTLDPLCQSIIEAIGEPVIAAAACTTDRNYPAHFGEIGSEIITSVDYVLKYRQDDKRSFLPSVIAKLGDDGEFEFIRE
jgi:L-threonylcarbamoyladenylate synthase